jgi:pimeloyl-ACP methyl ester carboxylesterase
MQQPGEPDAAALSTRLLSALAAGIDSSALWVARAVIDRTVMPPPEAADTLRRSAAFYLQPTFLFEPRRFFPFLERSEPVPAVVNIRHKRGSLEGDRVGLAFRSPYRPINPDYSAEYSATVENHTVHAELWSHAGGSRRGTVVVLHGFGMGYPGVDSLALMMQPLFASGLDVVHVTLPLHGARSPSSATFSGQMFAVPNVRDMNEAMGQSVHDLVALLAWLRDRNPRPVGLMGLSLGGYVTALMASLVDDLDFAIPIIAPVCMGDLAHRFMSTSGRYREHPDAVMSREEFQAVYRVHSPLAHQPRMSPSRMLIVAGHGDRIVPTEHAEWLREHWGDPRVVRFPGSHLIPFGRSKVIEAIRAFIDEVVRSTPVRLRIPVAESTGGRSLRTQAQRT